MALNLVRKVKQNVMEKTDRINLNGGWRNTKVEAFINSCEYDMEQKDVEALDFRVRRFLMKNEELEQMVWERLFQKVWNPDDDPIFNWIIQGMDKKTLEHILKGLRESNVDNAEDECEFDPLQRDLYEEGEEDNFDYGMVDYDDGEEECVWEEDCDEEKEDDGWDEFQKLPGIRI